MIVIADASAVGSFLLKDEAGPFSVFAQQICAENDVHVPAIWPTELASLITVAHRRGRLDDQQRDIAVRQAEALLQGVTLARDPTISTIVRRAHEASLSAYDTSYLLLAERAGGAILTSDGPLSRAAEASGMTLLRP